MHVGIPKPSDWVERWAHLIQPSQAILDVASGTGRHAKLFADNGCTVTAIDRSSEALQTLRAHSPAVRTIEADIENAPWPLLKEGKPELFDGIVVTNYLHRPLMPSLLASLAPNGVLIYETFAVGNEAFGKPSRPDFLLKSKELLLVCKELNVVAYEEGFLSEPDRVVQRVVATKQTTKMQPLAPHL
jgi:SAM-dependent methyltransferase